MKRLFLCFLCALILGGNLWSADGFPERELSIAVTQSPPFSYVDESGDWQGMSVALWKAVAEELDVDFAFRGLALQEVLEGLENGDVDVASAALSVTAEREQRIDYSHAFYQSGLTVAAPVQSEIWSGVSGILFSSASVKAIGSLCLVLAAVGCVLWLVERSGNRDQFGGPWWRGLGNGFWWSAVTMTTVGYGDKAPTTFMGRVVGLVWMFASIIVISGFTAAIATAFTVSMLKTSIDSFDDLYGKRVGVVEGSLAESYMESQGLLTVGFSDTEAGLDAVVLGNVDAFVNDAAVLKHLIQENHSGELMTIEETRNASLIALGLPQGAAWTESLNLALLDVLHSDRWLDIRRRFLGADEQ